MNFFSISYQLLFFVFSSVAIDTVAIRVGLGNEDSSRLVVTFHTALDNKLEGVELGEVVVVKHYGRRLVLDLGTPFDLERESDNFKKLFRSVQSVEYDYLVSQEQTENDQVIVNDALVVTEINATDPDMDGAYISPATQTPLWNLMDSEPYSIHAEGVWPLTNSTPDVVVAVIDTGIADPAKGIFLNLMDGYDFISDTGISVDEDGRDPDATDPGDWGEGCPTPSWHGTKVASILAARHDNTFGMKGVAQNCSVLPVRVLGLCRMGYATDVTDAIVWAAGGVINGVPVNSNPAKIISLSLAGQGKCPGYLQSAIDQALSLEAIVVAAAGNNNQNVSGYFPANCAGVVAVAASTRDGKLAGYSNWGNLIAVAAPGGDTSNAVMALGLNAFESGLEIAYGAGTSFAVPHVAGVAAMYSSMSYDDVRHSNLQLFFISSAIDGDCTEYPCVKEVISADPMVLLTKNYLFLESFAGWNVSKNLTVNASIILDLNLGKPVPIGHYCCSFDRYFMEVMNGVIQQYAICISTCPCQSGKYQPTANIVFCTECPAGSVSKSTTGSTTFDAACTVCPVNTYGSFPSTACTSCVAGTYSNPGSSECKSAITCAAGSMLNPSYDVVSSSYTANCPLGSYVCGFNYQNLFGYYFYCCALGGAQVGHWRISNSNFNGGIGAGVFYTPTSNGFPSSPFTAPNTKNLFQDGISRVTWNYNGVTIYSNGVSLFVLGGTGADVYDTTCQAGKVATGFYGWWGAAIDQASVMCNTLCIVCPAGSFSTIVGATVCTSCSTGKYSATVGASLSSVCLSCAAGKYSATIGASLASVCLSCAAGKYSATVGASLSSVCLSCAAGGYSAAVGASAPSVCLSCAAGSYSATVGASLSSVCLSCDAGTYSATVGASLSSVCISCAAGKYSATVRASLSSACLPCAAGTYSATVKASLSSVCLSCAAGTYSANVGASLSSLCLSCPAGTYSATVGASLSSLCLSCAAGTYSATAGASISSVCVACVPGTHSSSAGAMLCNACEKGKYTATSNTVNCSQCGIPPVCYEKEYLINCSTTAAARCATCNDADKPLYSSWLWSGSARYNCVWGCDQGYFRSALNMCEACRTSSSCAYNQYVTNCNATADGVCLECSKKPLNSFYTASSDLVGVDNCDWSCNDGYKKNLISSTCEACTPGTYAVDSPESCTPCQAGKYSSTSSAIVCLDCSTNTYASTSGASACKPCPICPFNGYFKEECIGASAGLCSVCTNTID